MAGPDVHFLSHAYRGPLFLCCQGNRAPTDKSVGKQSLSRPAADSSLYTREPQDIAFYLNSTRMNVHLRTFFHLIRVRKDSPSTFTARGRHYLCSLMSFPRRFCAAPEVRRMPSGGFADRRLSNQWGPHQNEVFMGTASAAYRKSGVMICSDMCRTNLFNIKRAPTDFVRGAMPDSFATSSCKTLRCHRPRGPAGRRRWQC